MPYFRAVFDALDVVLARHGVSFYLIGATAKDIQMLLKNLKPIRATFDIDFAIMVPDHDTYAAIMEDVGNNGFTRTREPYRVKHTASDTEVDILPFGQIEERGTVRFDQRDTALVMLGFSEVLNRSVSLQMEDGRSLKVPPLAGMCLLKLLAYSDRPSRTKDLDDILRIATEYYDMNLEEVVNEHEELLDETPFDRVVCGARVIGREIGATIRKNSQAVRHIVSFLDSHLIDPETSHIALRWAQQENVRVEIAFAWLSALRQGILERTNP